MRIRSTGVTGVQKLQNEEMPHPGPHDNRNNILALCSAIPVTPELL
jgi:hypothetical protein